MRRGARASDAYAQQLRGSEIAHSLFVLEYMLGGRRELPGSFAAFANCNLKKELGKPMGGKKELKTVPEKTVLANTPKRFPAPPLIRVNKTCTSACTLSNAQRGNGIEGKGS